ncbi:senescence-specific cysteine protease sag12 [Quercus suber]|uniref:Senescence-specific cysteine protease sag12 n=1 Tax=Quercus suber TaxID=58331 RepID=A0AAW0MA24_QUESU
MGFTNQSQWIFFALILGLGALAFQATARTLQDESMRERHEQWMAHYGRVYEENYEKENRFKIFKENVARIESSNSDANKSYKLSANQFADLTNEEFKASRNRFKGHECSTETTSFKYENVTALPSSMDWRKKGAVTPIKDQGQCAMEGITQLTTGKLISLSEQELVNCDTKGVDQGCQGGLMDNAFKFKHNHGLTTEANYPYMGVDGTCNANEEANDTAKITGYEDMPANSEQALLKAVANQPVSVSQMRSSKPHEIDSRGMTAPQKHHLSDMKICWAFSAVAAMEGITQLTTGKLISLSEQELVDCNTRGENQGCEGGSKESAFQFIQDNHGLTTKASYPYTGVDGTCNANQEANTLPQLMGMNLSDFQFYSIGVFTGAYGTSLDHDVTAVGYGVSNDRTKYWLVKNSWGTQWGEERYIRMQRDVAAQEGLSCTSQAMPRTLQDVMYEKHEQWMAHYGRVYKDIIEKEKHYKIFKEDVAYIESFNNAADKPYKLNLTNEEFKASRNRFKGHECSTKTTSFKYENVTAVPSTLDWRKKGAMTPIKDQGQCSCCWAFSAVAATEGITQLTTGKLISLSEQELVDCDTSGVDQGCEGGLMDNAFQFIQDNHGLTTEAS